MIEIKIQISDINYENAIEEYMPIIANKLEKKEGAGIIGKLIGTNGKMTTKMVNIVLSTLSQDIKDDIAVAIIDIYKEEIALKTMEFAEGKGLSFQIEDIIIKNIN